MGNTTTTADQPSKTRHPAFGNVTREEFLCNQVEQLQGYVRFLEKHTSRKELCVSAIKSVCGARGVGIGVAYRDIYDRLSDNLKIPIRQEARRRGYTSVADYIADNGYTPHLIHVVDEAIALR